VASSLPVMPSTFEPVSHRSLPDAVLDQLRRIIVNGNLPAGKRLVETELADQLAVSRATVRQVFRQLEFEGLVEVRPRRGTLVSHMSNEVALEVCQARGVLEGFAARTACRLLSTEQLDHLRELADRMGDAVRAKDVLRVAELDTAFHALICASQPNRRLYGLWSTLTAQNTALIHARLDFHHYRWETVVDLHIELCDALVTADPDVAEAAVRSHYVGAGWDEVDDRPHADDPTATGDRLTEAD
jgi:DNA-binding GntR family transcriptional regulator